MSWLKVDDKMCRHPKVVGLTDSAFRLHMAGLGHCAEYETDGRVSFAAVEGLTRHRTKDKLTEELNAAGLWVPDNAGWIIHDYLEYNPSHAELKAKRDSAKERVRLNRSRPVRTNGAVGSREHVANVPRSSPEPTEPPRARAYVHAGRAGTGSDLRQDLTGGNGNAHVDARHAPAAAPVAVPVAAPVPVDADPDPFERPPTARVAAIAAEIQKHRCFDAIDARSFADAYESATMAEQKPIAWVVETIRECVAKYGAAGLTVDAMRKTLGGFMLRARRPRPGTGGDDMAGAAPQPVQDTSHDRDVADQRRRDRDAAARILAERSAHHGASPPVATGPEPTGGKP